MVHMFKYMAHPRQEQENQIIFGKPLMLSTFREVGWGFNILKKRRFLIRFNDFSRVYAVAYIYEYECTIPKYNKVCGINL